MSQGTEALERAIGAWNDGDHERYLQLYAPDVTLHSGSMGDAANLDAIRAMYQPIWDRYDSRLAIDDLFGEGDRVACRYRWIATDKATGKGFTVPGMTILHFAGDRSIERWDLEGRATRADG